MTADETPYDAEELMYACFGLLLLVVLFMGC